MWFRVFPRLLRTQAVSALGLCALGFFAPVSDARAQDASEQQNLFQQMVRSPGNHEVTFAYVKVATARGDYEAAIGALERLLFYNPKLTRVKYELGALYFRLGSYEMAKRYFKEALASPDVDAVTRSGSRLISPTRKSSCSRAGSPDSFRPAFARKAMPVSRRAGVLRLGGQDLALLPSAQRKSDINWFGLVGLSHDYDLQNQRGDILKRAPSAISPNSRV
jgi:tetratricopeptide (TPR) repeat protein